MDSVEVVETELGALSLEPTAHGYLRYPAVHGERIVFVCQDDLWEVPAAGGTARRLTCSEGCPSAPHFSPDGRMLAYTVQEEGYEEVYVMPSHGGRCGGGAPVTPRGTPGALHRCLFAPCHLFTKFSQVLLLVLECALEMCSPVQLKWGMCPPSGIEGQVSPWAWLHWPLASSFRRELGHALGRTPPASLF